MANQEHLEILLRNRNSNAWNNWRKQHPALQPDFRGADLRSADLSGVDLYKADLSDAHLSNAYLFNADLIGANLSRAHLNGAKLSDANLNEADLNLANLSNAILCKADLRGAILREAQLSGADLHGANFSGANLSEADLSGANLYEANLSSANLSKADLSCATLIEANLSRADLSRAYLGKADLVATNLYRAALIEANLSSANLSSANLSGADLSGADLSGADLRQANLSSANLNDANLCWSNISEANCCGTNLTGCAIYAISAWNVSLEEASQTGLIITRAGEEATITVDNLEVAQLIYLLLNNRKIHDVIDTITSKVVLILGRFTPERKAILDVITDELRRHNYLPVLFDFEKPVSRDLTETVSTLAHLARFILVDLTDPSSTPHEVASVIPLTVVPIQPLLTLQPIIVEGKAVERHEYTMFEDLRKRYHWVLPTFRYQDTADLLSSLQERIIKPAEQKAKELAQR